VRVKVVNRGELSTSLTNRGRSLAQRCPPVQATFIPSEGAAVASASAVAEVGVLAGVLGASECEWFVTAAAGTAVLGQVEIEGGIAADVVVDVASV